MEIIMKINATRDALMKIGNSAEIARAQIERAELNREIMRLSPINY